MSSKKTAPAKSSAKVIAASTKKAGKEIAAEIVKPTGIIAQIIALHKKGKTQKQIIEAGFNKSTVYRQVLVYKTQNAAPVKTTKPNKKK